MIRHLARGSKLTDVRNLTTSQARAIRRSTIKKPKRGGIESGGCSAIFLQDCAKGQDGFSEKPGARGLARQTYQGGIIQKKDQKIQRRPREGAGSLKKR